MNSPVVWPLWSPVDWEKLDSGRVSRHVNPGAVLVSRKSGMHTKDTARQPTESHPRNDFPAMLSVKSDCLFLRI
jgi:hypothetical protein